MAKIESNLWKLYVIQALGWFMLIMPIIVLFYFDNGLSMKEVFLIQSVFAIVVVIFEVPSGYFADVIGRKASIILGGIFCFLGWGVYAISYGFWGFLMAEVILGVGVSFISGADSAMIYDTLLQIKKESRYKKIEGRYASAGNFAEAIAAIIGGLLAVSSLRTPFYFQAGIAFLAIPLSFTLIEPARHKCQEPQQVVLEHITNSSTMKRRRSILSSSPQRGEEFEIFKEISYKDILKIVKYSLHEHKELKWLIIYSGLIGASTLVIVWFVQPYLKLVGLPLAFFGVVWAALNISVGVFALSAHKVESFLGRKKSLVSLIFLLVAGYVLVAVFQSLWAIVFLVIFYFVRGITVPITKDYVNKLIPSDIRATVLSVKSLVARLIFSIIGPFVGWINDLYSLRTAFLASAGIFLFFGLISLIFLRKNRGL